MDEVGKPYCIFTGDTLFIGDVGRPDLAIKSNVTMNDLAGMLYDSLHNRIIPLPDELIVYPAHGAGSSCGKNLSKETFDTLGHQKQVNYALQPMSKEAFIKSVTEGLSAPPQYFPKNAMLNKQGAKGLDEVMQQGLKAWNPNDFENLAESTGALILDTRPATAFVQGFVPGSVFIGLEGQFAPWVGALIKDLAQPILLVCEAGKEEECVMRLARVGYDNTIGYLQGGLEAWKAEGKPMDSITSITADDFAANHYNDEINLLDVRRPGEFEGGHISTADNKPLDYINDWNNEVSRDKTYYIHCAGGYRSVIAASILKARGYDKLVDIAGGWKTISATNLPKESGVSIKK